MKRKLALLLLFVNLFTNIIASDLHFFNAGRKAFSVGLYSIALENFQEHLELDERDKIVDAIYLSGISLYHLKKYEKSTSYFLGLIKNFTESNYVDESLYWLGLSYYNLNDYRSAIDFFNRNITSNSKYKDLSMLYRALAQLKVGQTDSAISSFKGIIESTSAIPRYKEEALYRLSTLYLEKNSINSGIITLNKLIFDYPHSKFYFDSLKLLADSYYIQEEWESALRSYLLIIDLRKDFIWAYSRISSIYYKQKNNNKVVEYSKKAIDLGSSDIDTILNLGHAYINLANNLEAINTFNTIINEFSLENNEMDEFYYILGTLYYKENNFEDAYNFFLKSNTIESLYFTVLSGIKSDKTIYKTLEVLNKDFKEHRYTKDANNRYINYLEGKNTKKKLEEFLLYIMEIYPKSIDYTLTYGEFLLEENRLDESLKYLSVGYNNQSEFLTNITYKIGWIYYTKGEFARAIEYFNKIDPEKEEYLKSLYSKSIAYYRIGEFQLGKKGFLELYNSGSEYDSHVAYYLGLIEKGYYNYSQALKYFVIAKDEESIHISSLENIAWCNYYLKDYEKAIQFYSKLYTIDPQEIYIFNIANCYVYLDIIESALEYYKKVLELNGELTSNAYYKIIELLYSNNEIETALEKAKEFSDMFPNSKQPHELVLTNGDNRLYNGFPQEALIIYSGYLESFQRSLFWEKIRYRVAESYKLLNQYSKSIETYIDSVSEKDSFIRDSVKEIAIILSELNDPGITKMTIEMIEDKEIEKEEVLPVYIEYINQNINSSWTLQLINELISLSKVKDSTYRLIYLKSLHMFNSGSTQESLKNLNRILSVDDSKDDLKIKSILLYGQILEKQEKNQEAIDLYLNLYINYSKDVESSSLALYRGLILAKSTNNTDLRNKIINILKVEYNDTYWAKRSFELE